MKNLVIEATEFTPLIHFNPESLEFIIEGVSRPEDVSEFYTPIINWLIELKTNADLPGDRKIQMIFKLYYCNSASMKMITQILEILKEAEKAGFEVHVGWHYEDGDEQMHEDGEDLSDAVNIPFTFHTF